jgi:hypothetical protein
MSSKDKGNSKAGGGSGDDDSIRSASRHKPIYDADSINRAIEKAIKDENFLNNTITLLNGLKFPAFKRNIIDYVTKVSSDPDIIALFESLDDYIEFKNSYHIRKAIEENDPKKKKMYQITDKTREQPNVKTRDTTTKTSSIKEREAVSESEERKDYPEVTPTAMSDFICSKCGKSFQNQDDLVHHRHFERGERGGEEIEGIEEKRKSMN